MTRLYFTTTKFSDPTRADYDYLDLETTIAMEVAAEIDNEIIREIMQAHLTEQLPRLTKWCNESAIGYQLSANQDYIDVRDDHATMIVLAFGSLICSIERVETGYDYSN